MALAPGSAPAGDAAPRRIVLLGASNIARDLPTIVRIAQQRWGQPLDILAAFGHGRSYGMSSCVLGRVLPAILECGIWDELDQRPAAPTAVLITDVGNDILYGARAELIGRWVEKCLSRLAGCEQLTMTQLPLSSVETLGKARFFAARTILFPRSRLTLEAAIGSARHLNDSVVALAEEYDATLIQPERHWYGVDPIHIRPRYRDVAWQTILGEWTSGSSNEGGSTRLSLPTRVRLHLMRPAYRRLFGIDQRRAQPALRLSNGTTVSFF